jgi:hypothetical protein
MIRAKRHLPILLFLALFCGPALAQPQPPQSRLALDVTLPPPPDHKLSSVGPPGRLVVGPDGIAPAASARVELLAYRPDGGLKFRTMLPVPAAGCRRSAAPTHRLRQKSYGSTIRETSPAVHPGPTDRRAA